MKPGKCENGIEEKRQKETSDPRGTPRANLSILILIHRISHTYRSRYRDLILLKLLFQNLKSKKNDHLRSFKVIKTIGRMKKSDWVIVNSWTRTISLNLDFPFYHPLKKKLNSSENFEIFAISSSKQNLKRLRPDTHHIGGVDLHNVRERLSGLMNPLDANNTLRSWWQTQMFQQVLEFIFDRCKLW